MSQTNSRHSRLFGLTLLSLLLTVSLWIGCSEQFQSPSAPETAAQEEVVLSPTNPIVKAAMEVQDRHTQAFLDRPGIIGTATGMSEDGQPVILVFAKTEVLAKGAALPEAVEDIPVVVQITGEIRAIKGPPGNGGGFDPKAKHRPAPNGVSLGHPDITAGTLGCLVQKNGTTYILSNNHVMANENLANINDPIYQPGPYDGGTAADEIARLSAYKSIVFSTSANNTIDAAIAAVGNTADVTGETASVSYGKPRATTAAASVGLKVTKYGRTTEGTNGRVQGINATINIGYDSGTARFVNQIVLGGGSFSAGGDSGSLIVIQKGSNARKPIGLLFAGGGGTTIANPIDAVLSNFGVTVIGD